MGQQTEPPRLMWLGLETSSGEITPPWGTSRSPLAFRISLSNRMACLSSTRCATFRKEIVPNRVKIKLHIDVNHRGLTVDHCLGGSPDRLMGRSLWSVPK